MFKKFLICILLLCINLVGCLESKAVNSNNVEESYKSEKLIELYVPDDNISKWVVEEKNVDISELKNVITALKDTEKCCIPKETEVNSIIIENKIAYVDLSKDFDDSQTGSSAAVKVKIYSIVNTLCLNECFNVDGVIFLIDGKEVETIGPKDVSLIKTPKLEL